MAALAEEEFKIAGELMGSSVVQGGPAPSFLSSSTYAYIVSGVGSVKTDDADEIVENLHMKNAVNKVTGDNFFNTIILLIAQFYITTIRKLVSYTYANIDQFDFV